MNSELSNRPKTQPEFQIMLHKKDFIIKTLEEPQDFWQLYDCKAGIVCRPRILAKTPKKYSIKPIKQNINIDPKLKAAFIMAIRVVEFSNGAYKIKNIF